MRTQDSYRAYSDRTNGRMSDREARMYRWRLRRIREFQRKCVTAVLTVCLVIFCAISFTVLRSSASTGTEDACFKYYANITVESGETLWSIAGTYMDDVNYGSRQAYIAEVCSINNLRRADDLKAGQMLIVPYYSSVYVR